MKIIFDVDGVLIDGWHIDPDLRKPWNINLERDLGVNVKEFERAFFGQQSGNGRSIMDACVEGKRDLNHALGDVLPRLGYRGSIDAFIRYWLEKDSNTNQEVFDIVMQLNGIENLELYVATAQEHNRANYLWNELGFCKHFSKIFYSAEIGYSKRDPKFYQSINDALGVTASSEPPVFFDDQEKVVDLALAAGWDATIFNSVKDLRTHPKIVQALQKSP